MKIGIFTDCYFPIISGVSVSIETLRKELTKLGHEVYIITNSHENQVEQENVIRMGGVPLPMKGMHDYRIGKVTRKKVQQVREMNFDIVHCQTEFTMGRLGRKAAKKDNIPIVHTYHTMYEDYVHFISKALIIPLRYASKSFSRNFANSVDSVIFPTIKVKRVFDGYGFKKQSHIVPTGIYLDPFKPENHDPQDILNLKTSLGFDEDDFIVLFLGRLSREKSIVDLIKQFSKIEDKNVKLLLVGGGPDQDIFARKARKYGVEDRIVITGMVPPTEVSKYYQVGDIFVNFSLTETQGLTNIEALVSGLPLLVRYDDNLEDVIKHGYNGYSFNEVEEFLPLFDKLYNDRILLNQMKENALKDINRFSAQAFAKHIEEIYQNLVK